MITNHRKKVEKLIREKSLRSYMNKRKWQQLFVVIDRLPFSPPFLYKTIFDFSEENNIDNYFMDVFFEGDWSRDGLEGHLPLYEHLDSIWWIKISPRYISSPAKELEPEVHDTTDLLVKELRKTDISFEIGKDKIITIYAYR